MSLYPQWWRTHFLRVEFALSIIGGLAFSWWIERGGGSVHIDKLIQSTRPAIYGTLASTFGSLLGFVITAISIVLGFASHERLTIVKQSKYYPQLWQVFMTATRCLGVATIVALGGLIFRGDPVSPDAGDLCLDLDFGHTSISSVPLGAGTDYRSRDCLREPRRGLQGRINEAGQWTPPPASRAGERAGAVSLG